MACLLTKESSLSCRGGNNLGHKHDDDHEHYYDDSYLHDNQFVFLKHYLNTIQTCEKGLQFIIKQGEDNNFDLQMINDCIGAVKALKDANFLAGNLMKKIDRPAYEKIHSYNKLMITSLNEIEKYVEKLDKENVLRTIAKELFPNYTMWSKDVNETVSIHLKD